MHHFPTQFTSFLGRKSELAQMKEMLTNPDFRLVTIVGPGGMGKTRLAIEAAKTAAATQRFSGGIYFANLSAVESAEGLPAALAATLDLVSKTSAPSIEQLVEFLQARNLLLVLDNFEQVTGGERLVAGLIARAPNLTVVVTSRQLLHLKAERVIRLSGLAYPEEGIYHPEAGNLSSIMSYDAVRLFVQSARSVKPDFALTTNNIEPVVRITSLAQGMPLALEIAASWVRVMKAETIAETIERSLEFLTSPMHDLPERHQSMTAVFDHSWKLLTSGEQKTLAQLSVFRGSFTLETALTVADTTINKIAALLDKSLLQSPTSGRYMLHEFLRQYMLAKFSELAAGSELESTTRRKHSDHYMNLVAGSVNDFFGSEPQTAAKRLRRRLGNITQAWDWAIEHCDEAPRIDALMCSIEGLVRFYDFLGLAGEGERIIGNALTVVEAKAAAGGLPEESFAKLSGCLLMWKALFLNRLGQIDNGIQTAEEALKRGDPDSSILVQAKSLLGRMLPDIGQFDRGETYQEEALSYFEALGDRRSAALAVGRLGVTRWRRGSYSKAIENLKKALGLQEALGDLGAAAELNRSIAGIYYEHQDYTNARLYVERAQREYKELGDVIGVARTNGNLALLFQKNAQYELALEFNQKEIDHYQETGVLRSVEITLGNRGGIYRQMGAVNKAITTFQEALSLSRKLGLVWNQARNMAALATIWHEFGDYQQAEAMYEEAIPILREHGAVYYYIQPLIGQAKTFLMQGRLEEASEVIAESLRLSEQTDIKEWFFESQTVVIRLKNARGENDDARQQISEMLAATRDPAEIAGLHYELWRINGEEEEAQAAYDLYRQLNEKLPHYDYQRRLATLETAVSY